MFELDFVLGATFRSRITISEWLGWLFLDETPCSNGKICIPERSYRRIGLSRYSNDRERKSR